MTDFLSKDQLPTPTLGMTGLLENFTNRFLQDKTYENAIRILSELSETDYKNMNIDRSEFWPNICELVNMLLKAVPLDVMLLNNQIVMLMLINHAPECVICDIVKYYFLPGIGKRDANEVFLPHAEAVVIALSRRVAEAMCNEVVSPLVAKFINVKNVQIDLLDQFKKLSSVAEYRFRLFHVVVCAMQSPNFDAHEFIRFLLDSLIAEMFSDDHLCAITAIEMLTSIAVAQHKNAAFLVANGVLQKTYKIMNDASLNVDAGLLFAGSAWIKLFFQLKAGLKAFLACIRFFGMICQTQPDSLSSFPFFITTVFNMTHTFDRLDMTGRVLAFETFAVVACTTSAKLYFDTQEYPKVRKTMNHFGVIISQPPDEVRVKMLSALAKLMRSSRTPEDTRILKKWFTDLGAPFPMLMYQFLKRPVIAEDTRVAALRLLQAMVSCDRDWAVELICSVDGFTDCILDRCDQSQASSDYCHEKFALIRRIAEPNAPACVNEKTAELCQQYIREGVFFYKSDQPDPEADWCAL